MHSHPMKLRGKVAALSRSRTPDDPALIDARQQLAHANLAAHVQRVLASAPPLTPEQREHIAALLRPHASRAGGAR